MNEAEIEAIEKRAYDDAVFATGFSEELAQKCVDKIYEIFFSQNVKNDIVSQKTGIDLDKLFKDKKHSYISLAKHVLLEDPLNIYAISMDANEYEFLRQYLVYGRHLIETGKIKSILIDPKETAAYKKLCSVIIGQDEMKHALCKLGDVFQYSKRREVYNFMPFPMHKVFAFVGPPGTAKTTAAVYFASMMKEMEVLNGSRMAYVTGSQLKAKYVGQTSERVHDVFMKNDIIIIDEAYSLVNYNESEKTDNFSQEALAQLCTEVEEHSNDKLIIFAGYGGDIDDRNNKMKQFLNENPGISSRITFTVNFSSYNTDEMLSIFELQAKNADFSIEDGWQDILRPFFDKRIKDDNFGNGREARRILELCMTAAAEDFMGWSDKEIDIFEPCDEKEKKFLSTIQLSHLKRAAEEFLKAEKAIKGREDDTKGE
jgi:hypothetical protein